MDEAIPRPSLSNVPDVAPAIALPEGWHWVTRENLYERPTYLKRIIENAERQLVCILASNVTGDVLIEFEQERPIWRELRYDRAVDEFEVIERKLQARTRNQLSRIAQRIVQNWQDAGKR